MKRILITGKNSYIGSSLEKYLNTYPGMYHISTVDTLLTRVEDMNFSNIDVVFHVAGIAHVKETKKTRGSFTKLIEI